MATANPDGGGCCPGGGGAGGAGSGVQDSEVDDYCGSSSVFQPSQSSARAAAAALAQAVVANPMQSHRWTSSLCGVDLDDEIWVVRFHFHGRDNLERTLGRSDITYLNLLALIETVGYGLSDYMYYVKEEGKGVAGLEIIDGMAKVEEMLLKYEHEKIVNLTVMKGKSAPPPELNRGDSCEEQVPLREKVYAIDDEGVIFGIQYNLCTQQSNNLQKDKPIVAPEEVCEDSSEEDYDSDSSDNIEYDMGEYRLDEHEEKRREEENEIIQRMKEMKRQRDDPLLHCEGDTNVEDIFDEADQILEEEAEPVAKKLKPVRKGPTLRSHSSVETNVGPDFVPSSPEESNPSDLDAMDDDEFEVLSFVLPKGRKSRAKKREPRKWYDETRLQAHEQLVKKMCFTDVYQFRRALVNLHITQSRNFKYHRNCKDRIIVCCPLDGCLFYMVASQISGEKTFCIRKMHLEHTCGSTSETTRVSSKWLAKTYEQTMRTVPGTGIQTIIENAMQQYGVEVPKSMAYRAKNRALKVVLGDQKKQYTRLRDYLQTVIDTNPGSRCIVTTKVLPEHPSPNPRFHGLFFCVNGAKEGFLKECRPFIGLDGCFIKLTTGQQLLAATGRDGNNNIYPIAFGIVDKEETASWCWFLTQLKYAIGGESGQFGHYTIISDRQKGLLNAINQVFPNCPQRFCLRHIYANFQTAGFRGAELKKYMDAASYSYTRHGFDVAMENLKNECEDAWKWLTNIPVHTWARHAMDYNCKTDLVVNNLSEVFNRMILDIRSKPIVTMVDGIRTKLRSRFHRKRTGAQNARCEITPTYSEILEEAKKNSRFCTSLCAGPGLWQVSSGEKIYAVNLAAKTCGCKKWDMTGLPCNHAISAIHKAKQHPEDYVHDFFKKPMYMEAYCPWL